MKTSRKEPPTEYPALGRRISVDKRDRKFMMAAVTPTSPLRRRYWWQNGTWLDQGQTGTCVGHAWAHWIEDGPRTWLGTIDPFKVYRDACALDTFTDNDDGNLDSGTSVRAGAQALQAVGRVTSYHWAFDVSPVVDAVLTTGPVVVGTWWREAMSRPVDGLVRVEGSKVGGHAYLINGVNLDTGKFRIKNSWGRSWGNRGYGWMKIDDMATLIADDGEACLAIETAVPQP